MTDINNQISADESRIDFKKISEKFEKNGCVVMEGFLSLEEVEALKVEMLKVVDGMDPKEHPASVFTTTDEGQSSRDDYFLTSSDKVRFFYEEDAVDKEGNMLVDKRSSFNKKLIREVGYKDPRIVQSMYIFKKVDYRFVRTHADDGPKLTFIGEKPDFDKGKYVAAPVKKGSCVLIHGLVWHKSEPNKSSNSRHAYTFHVVDQEKTAWSPDNWLQQTESYTFPSLFNNGVP